MSAIGDQIGQAVERRRDTEALRAKEARHRAMLDAALDCVVTMDHEGCVVDFNPAAERTFGHAAADAVGRDMAELIIPPELRERHRRGLARYLATEDAVVLDHRLEITGLRADGTTFPVELTITRIDVPGPPTFTGYIRDITDRKAAEAELRASRMRIVKAADEARRELERDLHDGAQQRLVELALDLRMARARLDDEPARAQELLDAALADLAEATKELRELARGIHPPRSPRVACGRRWRRSWPARVCRHRWLPYRMRASPRRWRPPPTSASPRTHERRASRRGDARGGRGDSRGQQPARGGSRRRARRCRDERALGAARAGRPRGGTRRCG